MDFLLINGGFTGFHLFWGTPYWSSFGTSPSRLIGIYPTTKQTLCFIIFIAKLFSLSMSGTADWLQRWMKIEKHIHLKIELQRMWKVHVTIVSLLIWCFGSVSTSLVKHLKAFNIFYRALLPKLQKSVLLNSCHISDWIYLKLYGIILELFIFQNSRHTAVSVGFSLMPSQSTCSALYWLLENWEKQAKLHMLLTIWNIQSTIITMLFYTTNKGKLWLQSNISWLNKFGSKFDYSFGRCPLI